MIHVNIPWTHRLWPCQAGSCPIGGEIIARWCLRSVLDGVGDWEVYVRGKLRYLEVIGCQI